MTAKPSSFKPIPVSPGLTERAYLRQLVQANHRAFPGLHVKKSTRRWSAYSEALFYQHLSIFEALRISGLEKDYDYHLFGSARNTGEVARGGLIKRTLYHSSAYRALVA